MRAIVTVTGKDTVGIIGGVCTKLSHYNVNILDISQTVLQGYFTMTMVVDASDSNVEIGELVQLMETYGRERNLSIRVQREDIFDAMHKI
jgi:ACT domain-containing protein